jgi:mRNA interferase MazF
MILRGEIYYANLNPVVGSEQGGTRPVLVLSNDIGNAHSPTVVVAPLTKQTKRHRLPVHVRIPKSCGLDADSLALAEQIRTIDRSRLGKFVGRIGIYEQAAIDNALAVSVGLDTGSGPGEVEYE